jgi:23S rRNA (uridine2552-2'-O)-methyltransferase
MARYDRKDAYHQRAKREGYRSRAAYKLAEIQAAHRVLRPGDRAVDLGCWPGGWLQVAAPLVGPKGRVGGVDLAATDPLEDCENTFAIQGDLTEPTVLEALLDQLGGPADVVLCDAAPKLTGIRATDRAREEVLLEAVDQAFPQLLRPGGTLLVKLLECPEAQAFLQRTRSRFQTAKTVKPKATRKGSTERYLLARGYAGGVASE